MSCVQRTASQRYALQIQLMASVPQTAEEIAYAEDSYTRDAIRETLQNLRFISERLGPRDTARLKETMDLLEARDLSLQGLWD